MLATLQRLTGTNADGSAIEPDARVRAAAQVALASVERRLSINEYLGRIFAGLSLGSILMLAAMGLAITYGLDPIFFGVLLAILMQIGGITPPVGILLNITCGMAGTKPGQCLGYIGVFVAVICAVVVLAIVFPSLITFLPGVFM